MADPFYRPASNCQVIGLGVIYESVFGCRRDGVFVEIGAHDGESYSNTSCLADLGWRGIYVEPEPQRAEQCRARHRRNNVSVLQCAVGDRNGETVLDLSAACGTTDPDTAAHFKRIGWGNADQRRLVVRLTTLPCLLECARVPADFDLLVVDTDGNEPEVFAPLDLGVWRPRMIIVELCDLHPSYDGAPALKAKAACLRRHILDAGYAAVYADAINSVFVRQITQQ